MRKIYKVKIIASVLITMLVFQCFSINSYAMLQNDIPENFSELSFEERYAWVEEHVEGEFVQGTIVNNSVTRTPIDPVTRIIYTAHRNSYLVEAGFELMPEADEYTYLSKLDVTYTWSIAADGSKGSISIDFIDAEHEVQAAFVRKDNPVISKSVNPTVGYGFCEVRAGFLGTLAYFDLFQYATLYYNGGTYFREVGNATTGDD